MKIKKGLYLIMIFALILLVVVSVTNIVQRNSLSNSLENVYERGFYDVVSNVNDLEVKLSKVNVSTSDPIKTKLLIEIWNESNSTANSLSYLPVSHQSISDATAFLNQLGAFSYVLATNLSNGETISEDDAEQLETLHTTCLTLQADINDVSRVLEGDYRIIDNIDANNLGEFSTHFANVQQNSVDYPALIYDGPFSESVLNKTIRGLPDTLVTIEEAKAILTERASAFDVTDVKYDSTTEGEFKTFDFTLTTKYGNSAYVQMTERGGLMLAVSNSRAIGDITLTQEQCIAKAESFANIMGVDNMKSVWVMENEGVAYVNLAYYVNDTIYYPDLIKVKVAMDNSEILGYEASTYAYNHTDRTYSPTITESQAEAQIKSDLSIRNTKLAVIPSDYVKEVFTYEIECVKDGLSYFIYINASSGEEEDVLRVVDTDQGTYVQ